MMLNRVMSVKKGIQRDVHVAFWLKWSKNGFKKDTLSPRGGLG